MANVLKREKQIAVLKLLSEGNSIRSTERLTGIHRDTIMRVMVRFGEACRQFLDLSLSNLHLQHVQVDEIWTFVRKKQGKLKREERNDPAIGDIYLFTALDTDSKLLITYSLGKRDSENTHAFIADLERRMVRRPTDRGDDRPQISTDGFGPYPPAIDRAFNQSVRHGILIKNYTDPESGRYQPPSLRKASRFSVYGIKNLATICTSHVERCNLTIRTFMRRFTRLALGFSKKLDNLAAATAIHVAVYNFCRMHRTLACTPAMAAGVVPDLWTVDDLYDNVMQLEQERQKQERYERLIKRISN